jgi:hypothetical protein
MALPLFMQMTNCSHKHRLLSECSKFRIKKPDLFIAPPFHGLLAIGAQHIEEEDANAVRSGLPPSSPSLLDLADHREAAAPMLCPSGALPTLPQQLASLLYPLPVGEWKGADERLEGENVILDCETLAGPCMYFALKNQRGNGRA